MTPFLNLVEGSSCLSEDARDPPAPLSPAPQCTPGSHISGKGNGAWTASERGQKQVVGEPAEETRAVQPRPRDLAPNSTEQSQERGSDLILPQTALW